MTLLVVLVAPGATVAHARDILWHNSTTGETQIWLMHGHQVIGRRTVLGEDASTAFVGLPWRIAGVSVFTRDRTLPDPDEPR
jgi:hypothetical protein